MRIGSCSPTHARMLQLAGVPGAGFVCFWLPGGAMTQSSVVAGGRAVGGGRWPGDQGAARGSLRAGFAGTSQLEAAMAESRVMLLS